MRKYRIFALVLCLCLLLALLPAGALAAEDVIHISTPSELRALAEKCRLDSWSVGKTVIIECDIDFSDAEFVPIPSFGGVFDGGGHSLTGIELKGDGSAVGGFFRFVQAGAIVKNMNVEGRIEPEMNAESFGGIAGVGAGTLPAERIIGEHVRLGSSRAILARSFCNTQQITDYEEIEGIFQTGIPKIRAAEEQWRRCAAPEREENRFLVQKIVEDIVERM